MGSAPPLAHLTLSTVLTAVHTVAAALAGPGCVAGSCLKAWWPVGRSRLLPPS
jgi:hypothetical protein